VLCPWPCSTSVRALTPRRVPPRTDRWPSRPWGGARPRCRAIFMSARQLQGCLGASSCIVWTRKRLGEHLGGGDRMSQLACGRDPALLGTVCHRLRGRRGIPHRFPQPAHRHGHGPFEPSRSNRRRYLHPASVSTAPPRAACGPVVRRVSPRARFRFGSLPTPRRWTLT
jgi:hypothetical protein